MISESPNKEAFEKAVRFVQKRKDQGELKKAFAGLLSELFGECGDVGVRIYIGEALDQLNEKSVVPVFVGFLRHRDAEMRRASVSVLGR